MPRGYDSDGDRTGKGSERRNRTQGQTDSEFVQLELSVEEKKQLRASYDTMEGLDEALQDFLEQETKITIKWEERNRCYVAFAFPAQGSENDGYILTGRGGSVTRALRELAYKDLVMLQHDWASYHNRARAGGEDDW